jgi:hypothetical protein
MVQVGIEIVIVIVLLIFSIGMQIQARLSARDHLEGYDIALDEMKNSLNVVAQVLHKLPDLVPQFSLVNENPLSQILQFFQQRAQAENDTSLTPPALRDEQGKYSEDGTTQEQEIT